MKLILVRPLAFFDIESTGKNPQQDRIVELGIIVLYPDGTRRQHRFLVNPTVPIPDEVVLVHGITNEMVKDCPTFKEVSGQIVEVLEGCDLGGFNSNKFDIPMLDAELRRAGIDLDFSGTHFVDIGVLFKIFAPRTLTAAVLGYLFKDHEGAHGALADTEATIDVLFAQLEKHPECPVTVEELALKSNYDKRRLDIAGKFEYRGDGVEIFTFGQHKGEPLATNKSYLEWMLKALDKEGKPSFSQDTKNVINRMMGRDPQRVAKGPAILDTSKETKEIKGMNYLSGKPLF